MANLTGQNAKVGVVDDLTIKLLINLGRSAESYFSQSSSAKRRIDTLISLGLATITTYTATEEKYVSITPAGRTCLQGLIDYTQEYGASK